MSALPDSTETAAGLPWRCEPQPDSERNTSSSPGPRRPGRRAAARADRATTPQPRRRPRRAPGSQGLAAAGRPRPRTWSSKRSGPAAARPTGPCLVSRPLVGPHHPAPLRRPRRPFCTNETSLRKVVRWAGPLAPDLVFLTGDILGDPGEAGAASSSWRNCSRHWASSPSPAITSTALQQGRRWRGPEIPLVCGTGRRHHPPVRFLCHPPARDGVRSSSAAPTTSAADTGSPCPAAGAAA